MSEMKRIALPLNSVSTTGTCADGVGPTKRLLTGQQEMQMPSNLLMTTDAVPSTSDNTQRLQSGRTFRIELELFEPNANWFPEFHFNKLIDTEKKKSKKHSKVNGVSDPFEENDDDVARIAKGFEAKYGGVTKTKSGKRDDYYDKGAGYDESDSFIDNTEAYDEIIPEEVETVEGGFYINSGALEFTHLSNYEKVEQSTKVKKRILSTSSSSSDDDKKNSDEESTKNEDNKESTKSSSKHITLKNKNSSSEKKVKFSEDSLESHTMKMEQKDNQVEPDIDQNEEQNNDKTDDHNEKDVRNDGEGVIEKSKPSECFPTKSVDEVRMKTTTIKDMLKAKRDNFRKMRDGKSKSRVTNGSSAKSSDASESSNDSSDGESDTESEPAEKKVRKDVEVNIENGPNDMSLPSDLPENVVRDIEQLKANAKLDIERGKGLQLDDRLMESLLRIEDSCTHLDKNVRDQAFAHLEHKWSLPKHYLLRKIKAVRIKQEKSKTKKSFVKLTKAVVELMPSVIVTYEMNCKKVDEERRLTHNPEEAQPKYPKKKFPWNDTLRNLLYELYQVRRASYPVLRTKRESPEDFVNDFLKQKVVTIWPAGWMKYEDLQKELEKRKINRKRPKENKKPGERSTSSKHEHLSSKNSAHTDATKSVLSNCNTGSVLLTKNLVVTTTTARTDKNMENTNDTSQVYAPQSKSHKLSSTKSNNVTNTISSSSTNQSRSAHKSTVESSVNNDGIQSQENDNDLERSSNVPDDVLNARCSLSSPTKRATDHSINSIMASNSISPSTVLQHSKNEPNSSGSTSHNLGKNDSFESSKTHVVNVDKLKSTSEIINTTNQILSTHAVRETNPSSTNTSSSAPKEGLIRIRAFAKFKNTSEHEQFKKDASKSKQNNIVNDKKSDSESDDCKIVDEYPIKKSSKLNTKQGNIRRGNSNNGSRSISPSVNMPSTVDEMRKVGTHMYRSSHEAKDSAADVSQIMHALKELEEMIKSSKSSSHAGESPTSSQYVPGVKQSSIKKPPKP